MRQRIRGVPALLLLLVCLCQFQSPAVAHEVPADARLNLFVKPEGAVLRLIARIGLASLGDGDYPTRAGNFVVVSRADEALAAAARVALLPALTPLEDAKPLGPPRIVAVRMSLPSDRSFESYETALASFARPRLEDGLDLYWGQQVIDVLVEYPIRSDRSRFALDIQPDRFGHHVSTALRFLPPQGETRAFVLTGNPGLVHLDPGWTQAFRHFLAEGVAHILGGPDHLLFLACLILPFARLRPLVVIVTAFTAAHSLTMIAAALGYAPDALWFPPLVEMLIAASILYMALENILGVNPARRWTLAFAFGLVHGFGFSFGLSQQLQFAGNHLAVSLLAFNLGVEIGQLGVLLVAVPLLRLVLTRLPSERLGVIVASALIAHTALHWLAERWGALAKFPLPRADVLLAIAVMRWAIAGLVLAGLVWLVSRPLNRWIGER